ncbi:hypothetical protein DPU05_14720 [Salmonella enterica subsp. enterica serovar Teddington]|nr:hypothetical protein [Salmonella enterica subsp. enterica serovar Teddington]
MNKFTAICKTGSHFAFIYMSADSKESAKLQAESAIARLQKTVSFIVVVDGVHESLLTEVDEVWS